MQVSGTVMTELGEPLIAATISYEQGSEIRGTSSDTNGKFSVSSDKSINQIEVSYMGYVTRRISKQELNSPRLDIVLIADPIKIEEMVIIAETIPLIERSCYATVCELNTQHCFSAHSKIIEKNESSFPIHAEQEVLVTVFPNPARDMIQVVLEQDCPLKLVSLSGQIVMEIQGLKGQNEINLVDLASGQYRLFWQKEGGNWESVAVMKE